MSLASLAVTRSGLRQIRQEAEERLTFVNLAAYSGDMKRLSTQEKNAFHSLPLRFLALQEAVGRHHQVTSPNEIADKAASMDWDAPLLPRRAFSLPSAKGDREMSKSLSVEDTAKAYLLKMILEAEWGSDLDPYSYGVSGKGVADAIGSATEYMYEHPMWYFKTDVKACFASIDHSYFAADLQKKVTRYMWNRLQPHLVATVEDGQALWCPETGITTGSPLSTLALDIFLKDLGQEIIGGYGNEDVRFFRYIDDVLILSPDIDILRRCAARLQGWLEYAALELNKAKTSIGTTAAIIDERIQYGHDLYHYSDFAVPFPRPGVVFLGARLSHCLDPEGKKFETWVELEIPKEKIAGKSREDKEAYQQAIGSHIKNIRKKVGDKAYVGSWLTHEYHLHLVSIEPDEFNGVRKEGY